MKPRWALLVVVLAGSAACKGAPMAPTPQAPAATAQPMTNQLAVQTAQPGLPNQGGVPPPATFLYNPTGLRDPFEPFIKFEEKKAKGPAPRLIVAQTPLQRYAAEELKLVGVVWGEEGRSRALIEDPQGKGYAVGVGTLVGDRGGRVARILPDRIVIEEKFKDVLGEERKNVANMMLHKSEGEVAK